MVLPVRFPSGSGSLAGLVSKLVAGTLSTPETDTDSDEAWIISFSPWVGG
jgi:hypothetical protein